MHNRKKLVTIALVLMTGLLLCGAKFFDVELLVKDPFVDLTKVIEKGGTALPNSAALDAYETVEEMKSHEADQNPDQPKTDAEPDEVQVRTTISIRVQDQRIYVDGVPCAPGNFETVFRNAYRKGMTVELKDDYGEYKAVRKVLKCLEKHGVKPDMRGGL